MSFLWSSTMWAANSLSNSRPSISTAPLARRAEDFTFSCRLRALAAFGVIADEHLAEVAHVLRTAARDRRGPRHLSPWMAAKIVGGRRAGRARAGDEKRRRAHDDEMESPVFGQAGDAVSS